MAFLLEGAFFEQLAAAVLSDPDSVGLALFLGGKCPNDDDDALVVALALVEWSAIKRNKNRLLKKCVQLSGQNVFSKSIVLVFGETEKFEII